jgi:nitroreductase
MKTTDVITSRRTIRLYDQRPIPPEILRELVHAARLAPSAANLQPLEFIAIHDAERVSQVFPFLAWAGYVAPQRTPPPGKQPVAYIVVLINRNIRTTGGQDDAGAAIENLLLAAWEKGIGGCWIGSVNRDGIRELLSIPTHLDIEAVISLGYPAEEPVWEDMTDTIKYYLDDDNRLHVPKRRFADVLHENCYREKHVHDSG